MYEYDFLSCPRIILKNSINCRKHEMDIEVFFFEPISTLRFLCCFVPHSYLPRAPATINGKIRKANGSVIIDLNTQFRT
jgi:hypothetical protein